MSNERSRNLAANLKLLCSLYPSVAQVCRELGINRQQFNKYLAAHSMPTPHTLRRICEFFDVDQTGIVSAPDVFATEMARRDSGMPDRRQVATRTFETRSRSDRETLRNYCGYYNTYFNTPAQYGSIIRGFCAIYERNGQIRTRTYERLGEQGGSDQQAVIQKSEGIVILDGGYIYVHECTGTVERSHAFTVIYPNYRPKITLLNGVILSVTSFLDRRPFASNIVYARLDGNVSIRREIRRSCILPKDTEEISPEIRHAIRNHTPGHMNMLLGGTFAS